MFVLRQYQEDAVAAGMRSLEEGRNGLLVLPTGSGKSLAIASLAKRRGGRAIVLQPTREILEQNQAKMIAFGHRDIGVYSASLNTKRVGAITLATIGSVIRKKSLFREFDIILVDEAHLVNSKGGMYEKFINDLGHPTVGFTATPYRMRSYNDQHTGERVAVSTILTRTRPRIFSRIAHITQTGQLFDAGYLSPMEYECDNDYRADGIASNSTGQGFDDRALATYNQRMHVVDRIVERVRLSRGTRAILIFTQFRHESQEVVKKLAACGENVAEVSAETPKRDREQLVKAFKSGGLTCVVNVGVLTTGFDFPELDCIVLGRPTKSVALYYQMVGRGVRPAPGKDACRVVDLCDNVRRFGKIETFRIYDVNGNQMWRLRSNVGDLTGVDATTGRLLEKVKMKKR